MTDANAGTDPAQFIACARAQMGDLTTEGSLAQVFSSQATTYVVGGLAQSYPNFWQLGCAFDTILDYFLMLADADQLTPADQTLMGQLVDDAVSGYQYGIVGINADWYDDWCWWGIAASKAFDPAYEQVFGGQLSFFQSAALDLWGLVDGGEFKTMAESIPDAVWANAAVESDPAAGTPYTKAILAARGDLHKGTRKTWATIELGATPQGTDRQKADYVYFTADDVTKWAVPRYPGGAWQYDMSSSEFPVQDGPDWQHPWPSAQTLGVFQVTLMSGLYLSFCCNLWAAAGRQAAETRTGGAWDRLGAAGDFEQAATEVVAFLTSWFEAPKGDSLVAEQATGVLVHERTPTYAELNGAYPPLQGYGANAFWGGDQGLLMGALTQFAVLVGEGGGATGEGGAQPIYVTYPDLLLSGVIYNMRGAASGPYWLVAPYSAPADSPIARDDGDYGSGSGIFWRYVALCSQLNPAFVASARSDATIVGVATASGTKVNGWGDALFQPFNGVAAAVGAWRLLN